MNRSTRVLAACLAALLAAPAASAQTAKAKKAQTKKVVGWAAHPRLMGPSHDCADDDSPCNVPVTMTSGTVDGTTICLATVPTYIKVKLPGGLPAAKTIAWNLTPPTGAGVEYSFEPDYGILVLANPHLQLFGGKIGTSKAQYVIKNRRRMQAEAVYLPIILQTDTSNGVVTLCAASDPKIVNE